MVRKLTLYYVRSSIHIFLLSKFKSFCIHIFFSYKCLLKFFNQSGPYTVHYESIMCANSFLSCLCWYWVEEFWSILQDREITAASEKLAECQETILNLGKQLKAMAAPKDASLFDNVIAAQFKANTNTAATTTTNVDPSLAPPKFMKVKSRSLLDQMLADDTKAKVPKGSNDNSNPITIPGVLEPLEKILVLNGVKDHEDRTTDNSLAIVPAKKPGSGSLWRKLLRRRKKSAILKISL